MQWIFFCLFVCLTDMSVNFRSSSNCSLRDPNITSEYLACCVDAKCFLEKPSSLVFIPFSIVNFFLILPLCIFILNHGFKQWQENRSNSFAAAAKHSNYFTYHAAFLELMGVLGCFLCFCGVCGNYIQIISVGFHFYTFTCFGESFFHILTGVEHYLAIVHPITYMRLRNVRGIQIRNTVIVCTWLLCVVGYGLMGFSTFIISSLLLILTIIIITFCGLSVLCALIRPRPGEQAREKVDQSKKRALYTIAAILGVLVLRFTWGLLWTVLGFITGESDCLSLTINAWFNLPSSLVLPILFLIRAGKCGCQKKNDERRKRKSRIQNKIQ